MHAAEDVLSMVRRGDRPVTAGVIGDCLICLDQVVQWLDVIEESGELPGECRRCGGPPRRPLRGWRSGEREREGRRRLQSGLRRPPPRRSPFCRSRSLCSAVRGEGFEGRIASAGRLATNVFRHLGRFDEAERIAGSLTESLADLDSTRISRAIELATVRLAAISAPDPIESVAIRSDPLSRTLRIDAQRVDALVSLTGELTVTKNAIGHIAMLAREGDNALAAAIADEYGKLDHLIGGLQRAVLELRVLPLRGVFQRFSRLVREMSESLAKPARLAIEGEDTHADKAIVEMLFEPLLHVVRNAMDHGVETSSERASAGKPPLATIHLRARREGEHVIVEVEDDGRGIDADRIRKAAIERGVVSADALAGMSEGAVIDLIFIPGFSTAADVTDLSGRGVGMDAVRASIERLGGRVQLETVRAPGARCVSSALQRDDDAGDDGRGGRPDCSAFRWTPCVETVRVPREEIQSVGHAQAFVLRNRTIPLIELGPTLGWAKAAIKSRRDRRGGVERRPLGGLEVDKLGERMTSCLSRQKGYCPELPEIAGTTVLGDGGVLLVLDIKEVLG